MSVVRLACQHNQVLILEYLHLHEVNMFPPSCVTWHDDSPIYIGCRYGHRPVIDFLITYYPSK